MNRLQRFAANLAKLTGHHAHVTNVSIKIQGDSANPGSVGVGGQASLNRAHLEQIQTTFAYGDSQKIMIVSMTDEFDFQNQSNFDVYMDIYQIVARTNNAQTSGGVESIGSLYQNSIDEVGGSGAWRKPGFSPFDSSIFTKLFKIVRVRRVRFKLGERKQFLFHRKPMNFFQFNQLDYAVGSNFIRGQTWGYLFIGRGTVADAEATNAINNSDFSISGVYTGKVTFRQLQSSVNILGQNDSRDATGSAGNVIIPAFQDVPVQTN